MRIETIEECVRMGRIDVLSFEERQQLLTGLLMLKRRYAVYCFATGQEIYDCTSPDEPLAIFEDLASAIKDASKRVMENYNDEEYYERYVATVVDRMTDKDVYRTNCIEIANKQFVVIQKYESLWEIYNAGAISMDIYRTLQKCPWEEVEPIVNGPDASNNLTRYIDARQV